MHLLLQVKIDLPPKQRVVVCFIESDQRVLICLVSAFHCSSRKHSLFFPLWISPKESRGGGPTSLGKSPGELSGSPARNSDFTLASSAGKDSSASRRRRLQSIGWALITAVTYIPFNDGDDSSRTSEENLSSALARSSSYLWAACRTLQEQRQQQQPQQPSSGTQETVAIESRAFPGEANERRVQNWQKVPDLRATPNSPSGEKARDDGQVHDHDHHRGNSNNILASEESGENERIREERELAKRERERTKVLRKGFIEACEHWKSLASQELAETGMRHDDQQWWVARLMRTLPLSITIRMSVIKKN